MLSCNDFCCCILFMLFTAFCTLFQSCLCERIESLSLMVMLDKIKWKEMNTRDLIEQLQTGLPPLSLSFYRYFLGFLLSCLVLTSEAYEMCDCITLIFSRCLCSISFLHLHKDCTTNPPPPKGKQSMNASCCWTPSRDDFRWVKSQLTFIQSTSRQIGSLWVLL